MKEIEQGLNAKTAFMKTRPSAESKINIEMKENAQAKAAAKKEERKITMEQGTEQETEQTKAMENKEQKTAEEQKQEDALVAKGRREWKNYIKEADAEGIKDPGKQEEYADKHMEHSIAQDQTKFKKLEYKNTKKQNQFLSDRLKPIQPT